MKYKVGDRVIVKSLEWYNANKVDGNIFFDDLIMFIPRMAQYCGMDAIITECNDNKSNYFYHIDIDDVGFSWIDGMFEDIKKVRKNKLNKINVLKNED
jgi:hypothetical protein